MCRLDVITYKVTGGGVESMVAREGIRRSVNDRKGFGLRPSAALHGSALPAEPEIGDGGAGE